MRRIAVLGAGIAGMSAALHVHDLLAENDEQCEIAVFERSARAGGCIQTLSETGFTLELGPDSLLIDKPAAQQLLKRLELEGEIVKMRPEYRGAQIVRAGRLRPLPSEFRLFAPASIPALLRSGIFSAAGLARAAIEPIVPPRNATDDESVGSFVTRRFGREVLERLAQPLIGGIYSGDPQRLSMQATLPQFLEMERRHGSVLRGMIAARKTSASTKPPELVTLRGGLQSIVDALAQRIGPLVRISSEVTSLSRDAAGWTIGFGDGSSASADGVVCALPANAAARVLQNVDAELAQMLESIRCNSIATINLAYDASGLPQLPATTGFVVPYVEGRSITAATISTQKYPNRSPQDGVLVRVFAGGALQPQLLELPDAQLADIARDELRDLLGIEAEPRFAVIRRWMRACPEYGVGHPALVKRIEERAGQLGGLALAGCALHGVGIPDCVASGQRAAQALARA